MADVIANDLPSLRTLRAYDEGEIELPNGDLPLAKLTYDEARLVIDEVAVEFPGDSLFGGERGDALRGVIDTIYQGFGGVELQHRHGAGEGIQSALSRRQGPPAHRRQQASCQLRCSCTSSRETAQLFDSHGIPRVSNTALAAITLMVAMSDPKRRG